MFSFFGANKIMLITIFILFSMLAASGWALKQSYKENGKVTERNSELLDANARWSKSMTNLRIEADDAQQRMVERETENNAIGEQLSDYRKELHETQKPSDDVNCITNAGWLLIESSADHPTSK